MLFDEGQIGPVTTKNRIVFPPISTSLASHSGEITERLIYHYERIARGGAGIITVENICIDYPEGLHLVCQPRADATEFIPGLSNLADAIHRYNALAVAELAHHGGGDIVNASERLVERIADKYTTAALRLKTAGFDCVEIQGAHGLLVNQFLSPVSNNRKDRYGGNLKNRTRFAVEIRAKISELCGRNFPVSIRLGVQDFVDGGNDIEDSKEIAKLLENAGYDCIHADVGFGDKEYRLEPMGYEEGWRVYLASELKSVVSVPVVAVGVLRHPEFADRILNEGRADFVAFGRALLAEPELPYKAQRGDYRSIRPCIGCNECVRAIHTDNRSIRCSVNAEIGRYESVSRRESRRVVIIGGGPAGITAALTMCKMDDEFHLFEKDRLCRTLRFASIPPGKAKIRDYITYLEEMVRSHDEIDVRRKTVTREDIDEISPDMVVVATGAKPLIPAINGIEGDNVLTPFDILGDRAPKGDRCVVLGAGLVGCETANFIAAEHGKRVILFKRRRDYAWDMEPISRQYLLNELRSNGVVFDSLRNIVEITDAGVVIEDASSKTRIIEADIVVCALGMVPDRAVLNVLNGYKYVLIGDAKKPRRIIDAVREGYDVGKGCGI